MILISVTLLYCVIMTGIMAHKHHPRDRMIVLLDSKCRHERKSVKDVKQEMTLEVDDLESISGIEGEGVEVKDEGTFTA